MIFNYYIQACENFIQVKLWQILSTQIIQALQVNKSKSKAQKTTRHRSQHVGSSISPLF